MADERRRDPAEKLARPLAAPQNVQALAEGGVEEDEMTTVTALGV